MEKSLRVLDLRGFIRSNSFFPREVKQWQLNYSLDTVLSACRGIGRRSPIQQPFMRTNVDQHQLRRASELGLIEDARSRGWQREVERHHCTVERIEQLLADLGEPLDGPEAAD
jgi:hypothetical protein